MEKIYVIKAILEWTNRIELSTGSPNPCPTRPDRDGYDTDTDMDTETG